MKIAIDIRNQDEYTLARKYCKKHGARCGFDSSAGKGFIYVLNTKAKGYNKLRVGCTKDIPEIKKQGYKYILASELFKDELKDIEKGFCCKEFRHHFQVKEVINRDKGKFYIDYTPIYYCPFCGQKL